MFVAVEKLMPSLQEIRRMILHQAAHRPHFRSLKAAAGREAARRQPKLALSIIPLIPLKSSINLAALILCALQYASAFEARSPHRRGRRRHNQPTRAFDSTRWDPPACRFTDQPMRSSAAKTRRAFAADQPLTQTPRTSHPVQGLTLRDRAGRRSLARASAFATARSRVSP